jgi:hypothetical protein
MTSSSVPAQMPMRRRPHIPARGAIESLIGSHDSAPPGSRARRHRARAEPKRHLLACAAAHGGRFAVRIPVNDGAGGVIAVTPGGAALARERGVAAVRPRRQASTPKPCPGSPHAPTPKAGRGWARPRSTTTALNPHSRRRRPPPPRRLKAVGAGGWALGRSAPLASGCGCAPSAEHNRCDGEQERVAARRVTS